MDKMSDKRKYKRIEKPYITRFRITPNEIQNMVPTSWDMVAANNLGAGGVFFNSSKDFEEGTTLDIKIGFSTSMLLIKCGEIVIRVKKPKYFHIWCCNCI